MISVFRLCLISVLMMLLMGSRGCVTTDTVVVPQGPVAAQLSAEKDRQIAGLVAQVKSEQEALELSNKQASLAAANFETILFAATHVDPGLPRNAIEEEAKLGKARSPAPDPQEIIKGKDRVIAILQNDVAKAKEAYGKAFDEAAQAKATIAAKDAEITRRDQEIKARADQITQLEQAAKIEREKHANDIKDALAKKDAEIQRVREEYASKERATWVLWARLASLGLVVVGVVLLAVFKLPMEGGGLAAGGVLIGLLSMFVEWLTAQVWWPWLCGLLVLGVLIAGGVAVYRMWKKHQLHNRVTAALQDLKDEANTLGHDTWEKVSEHLKYRLGDKDSTWNKAQVNEVAALGLIDPKGEAALKSSATTPPVDKGS